MNSRIINDYTVTNKYSNNHKAIDLVSNKIDVYAHSSGEIVMIQVGKKKKIGSIGNESYGNFVKIKHLNGYYTLYAHLESVDVKKGDYVKKGDKIGIIGDSGNAYGVHLHFEVRNMSDIRIDPTNYLNNDLPNMVKIQGHVENYGWSEWSSDMVGTTGKSLRLEAIRIDAQSDVYAKAHIENYGWIDYGKINKNTVIGTVGESRRLECLCLKGNFEYQVHIQNIGWTDFHKADGKCELGTTGKSLRIEAIRIR